MTWKNDPMTSVQVLFSSKIYCPLPQFYGHIHPLFYFTACQITILSKIRTLKICVFNYFLLVGNVVFCQEIEAP